MGGGGGEGKTLHMVEEKRTFADTLSELGVAKLPARGEEKCLFSLFSFWGLRKEG